VPRHREASAAAAVATVSRVTRVVLASASSTRLAVLRAAGLDPEVAVADLDEDALLARLPPGPPAEQVAALAAAKAEVVAARLEHSRPGPGWEAGGGAAPGGGPAPGPGADPVVVIGCDSMLELDGRLLGKPHTPEVAAARWRELSGATAVLHTGHAVLLLGTAGHTADRPTTADHAYHRPTTADHTSHRSTTADHAYHRPITADHTYHRSTTADHAYHRPTTTVLATRSTTVRFADVSAAEIDAYVATGEPLEVAGAFTLDGYGGWFVDGIEGDPSNVLGISLPLLRILFARVGVAVHQLWTPVPPGPERRAETDSR